MRAKKVRGTVEARESFRGKLVKAIREEASCCRTSCIYQGDEDQSFSIRSLLESKMACVKRDRVLVAEFVDGEQFVTEEIIKEGNRWPSIEGDEDQSFFIRSLPESKMACVKRDRVLVAEFVDGEQFVTEEIIKEGNRWPSIEEIEGNAKEYQIRGMELAVVVLN
ncbi:hypothetical protein Tco_1384142 [Tanacetum coccineum]